MSLNHKIDFAVIFTVTNANPNGDPLDGNRPRTTLEGLGEISDVCLKRKIRNKLMDMGQNIFVQSDDRRVDDYKTLKERATPILKQKGTSAELAQKACQEWYDVRAFGQVFALKDKDAAKGTGVSIGIRGPVTIQPAFSKDTVNITSTQITKSVSNDGDGSKKSSDTMGMKHRVDKGTYVFFGAINPQLAELTGFSDEDASIFKQVLPQMFEGDASSARPEGSMSIQKVIWWEHNCKSGQYSSAKVHHSIEISEDGIKNLDSVPSGEVYVDGIGVGDVGNIVLNDRKRLSQDGLIIVVATINTFTGMIESGPDIVSRGFVYVRENENLMNSARDLACRIIDETYDKKYHDWNAVKTKLRDEISHLMYEKTKRSPMILPVLMEI